jgi:hypothetical protein
LVIALADNFLQPMPDFDKIAKFELLNVQRNWD